MNPVAYELEKLGHEYKFDGDNESFELIFNDYCKIYEIDKEKIDDKDKEFAIGYYLGISETINAIENYKFDYIDGENTLDKIKEEIIDEAQNEVEEMMLCNYIDMLTSIFDGYAVKFENEDK